MFSTVHLTHVTEEYTRTHATICTCDAATGSHIPSSETPNGNVKHETPESCE